MPQDPDSNDDLMDLLFTTTTSFKKNDDDDKKSAESKDAQRNTGRNASSSDENNKKTNPVKPVPLPNDGINGKGTNTGGTNAGGTNTGGNSIGNAGDNGNAGNKKEPWDAEARKLENDMLDSTESVQFTPQTKDEQDYNKKNDVKDVDTLSGVDAPEHTIEELDEIEQKQIEENKKIRRRIVERSTLVGLLMSDPQDRIGYRADRAVATAFDGFSRFLGAMLKGDPMSMAAAAWYGTIANLQEFGKGVDSISARIGREFRGRRAIEAKQNEKLLADRAYIQEYNARHGNLVGLHSKLFNTVYDEVSAQKAYSEIFNGTRLLGREPTPAESQYLMAMLKDKSMKAAAKRGEGDFRKYLKRTGREGLIERVGATMPGQTGQDGIAKFYDKYSKNYLDMDRAGSVLMDMPESMLVRIRNTCVDKLAEAMQSKYDLDGDEEAKPLQRQMADDSVRYYTEILGNLDKYSAGITPQYITAMRQGNEHIARMQAQLFKAEADNQKVYDAETPALKAIIYFPKRDFAKQKVITETYDGVPIAKIETGKTVGGEPIKKYVQTQLAELEATYLGNPDGMRADQKYVSFHNLYASLLAKDLYEKKMSFLSNARRNGLPERVYNNLRDDAIHEYRESLKANPWRNFGTGYQLPLGPDADPNAYDEWSDKIAKAYKLDVDTTPPTPGEELTPHQKLDDTLGKMFESAMDTANYVKEGRIIALERNPDKSRGQYAKVDFDNVSDLNSIFGTWFTLRNKYQTSSESMTSEELKQLQILELLHAGHLRKKAYEEVIKRATPYSKYFRDEATMAGVLRNMIFYRNTDAWPAWQTVMNKEFKDPDDIVLIDDSEADMSAYGLDIGDLDSIDRYLSEEVFYSNNHAIGNYVRNVKKLTKKGGPLEAYSSEDVERLTEAFEDIWDGKFLMGLDEDTLEALYKDPSLMIDDIMQIQGALEKLIKYSDSREGRKDAMLGQMTDILACKLAESSVYVLSNIRANSLSRKKEGVEVDPFMDSLIKMGATRTMVEDLDKAIENRTGLCGAFDPAVWDSTMTILDALLDKAEDSHGGKGNPSGEEQHEDAAEEPQNPPTEPPTPPQDPPKNENLREKQIGEPKRRDRTIDWRESSKFKAAKRRRTLIELRNAHKLRDGRSSGLTRKVLDYIQENREILDKYNFVAFAGIPVPTVVGRDEVPGYNRTLMLSEDLMKIAKSQTDPDLQKKFYKAAKIYAMISPILKAYAQGSYNDPNLMSSRESLCEALLSASIDLDSKEDLRDKIRKVNPGLSIRLETFTVKGDGDQKTSALNEMVKILKDIDEKIANGGGIGNGNGGNGGKGSNGGGNGGNNNGAGTPAQPQTPADDELSPINDQNLNDMDSDQVDEFLKFNSKYFDLSDMVGTNSDKELMSDNKSTTLYSKAKKHRAFLERIVELGEDSTSDPKTLMYYLRHGPPLYVNRGKGGVSGRFSADVGAEGSNLCFEAMTSFTGAMMDYDDDIRDSYTFKVMEANGLITAAGAPVLTNDWEKNPLIKALKEKRPEDRMPDVNGIRVPSLRYMTNIDMGLGENSFMCKGEAVPPEIKDKLFKSIDSMLRISTGGFDALMEDSSVANYRDFMENIAGAWHELDDAIKESKSLRERSIARGKLWHALEEGLGWSSIQHAVIGGASMSLIGKNLQDEIAILGRDRHNNPAAEYLQIKSDDPPAPVQMVLEPDDLNAVKQQANRILQVETGKKALLAGMEKIRQDLPKIRDVADHLLAYDKLYHDVASTYPGYRGRKEDPYLKALEYAKALLGGNINNYRAGEVVDVPPTDPFETDMSNKERGMSRFERMDINTYEGAVGRMAFSSEELAKPSSAPEKVDEHVGELYNSVYYIADDVAKAVSGDSPHDDLDTIIKGTVGYGADLSSKAFYTDELTPRFTERTEIDGAADTIKGIYGDKIDSAKNAWIKGFFSGGDRPVIADVRETSFTMASAIDLYNGMLTDPTYNREFWKMAGDVLNAMKMVNEYGMVSISEDDVGNYKSLGEKILEQLNQPDKKGNYAISGKCATFVKVNLNIDDKFRVPGGSDENGKPKYIPGLKNATKDYQKFFLETMGGINSGGVNKSGDVLGESSAFISDPAMLGYVVSLANNLRVVNNSKPCDTLTDDLIQRISSVPDGKDENGKATFTHTLENVYGDRIGANLIKSAYEDHLGTLANPYFLYMALCKEYNMLFNSALEKEFTANNLDKGERSLESYYKAVIRARDSALNALENAMIAKTEISPGMRKTLRSNNPLRGKALQNAGTDGSQNDVYDVEVAKMYGLDEEFDMSKRRHGVFLYKGADERKNGKGEAYRVPKSLLKKLSDMTEQTSGDSAVLALLISKVLPDTYDKNKMLKYAAEARQVVTSDGRVNVGYMDTLTYEARILPGARSLKSIDESELGPEKMGDLGRHAIRNNKGAEIPQKAMADFRIVVGSGEIPIKDTLVSKKFAIIYPRLAVKYDNTDYTDDNTYLAEITDDGQIGKFIPLAKLPYVINVGVNTGYAKITPYSSKGNVKTGVTSRLRYEEKKRR